MDWTRQLDNYCERLDPSFWAEPVNAVTNAAFVIAAIIALIVAQRRGRLDWPVVVLAAIIAIVGTGSFLFHTFATVWAVMADVIPIQIFILFYFALAMRRFAGLPWWGAVVATAMFMVLSFAGGNALGQLAGNALNGSEGYVTPLLALIVVGAWLRTRGRTDAGRALITGGLLFAVSLTFRTIDAGVCPSFALGTHFIWHILNGILLGYLTIALARYGRTAA
ncbi:ceramidase domain-containing protein [Acuticoccus sp. MNP-M23]|uniref:ceramidase domain-containing protein n=1 Tax=Acuticoccus sp. MNP-M23 TaxID=3072793 RepID=UPI0028159B00|nr:ceramidase domain-containing protein [Acuticoccus sp. MNP-M23]WMS41314.1 ceramidase domain-containing protein [Acuticoccus sp. MNP-M23]